MSLETHTIRSALVSILAAVFAWVGGCSSAARTASVLAPRPPWLSCPALLPGKLAALGVAAARPDIQTTLDAACGSARGHLARAVEAQVISAGLVKSWESGDWGEVAGSAEAGAEAGAVAQGASTMGTWTDPANGDGYCLVAVDLESGADPCAAVLETAGTDCRAEAGESAGGAGQGAIIQRPTWVNSPPTAMGAVVATGVGRRSAYRANLLEAGVRDGMAGLVRTLGVKVGGLLEKLEHGNGGPGSEERVLSATGRLAGARLLAWWVDPSSGDAYTLVCLPAAGVKVRLGKELLERSAGAGGDDGAATAETPEQFHERKVDELRQMLDDTL